LRGAGEVEDAVEEAQLAAKQITGLANQIKTAADQIGEEGIGRVDASVKLGANARFTAWAKVFLQLGCTLANAVVGLDGKVVLIDLTADIGVDLSNKSDYIEFPASLAKMTMEGSLEAFWKVQVGWGALAVKYEDSEMLTEWEGTTKYDSWKVARFQYKPKNNQPRFFWCANIFGKTVQSPERCAEPEFSMEPYQADLNKHEALLREVIKEPVLRETDQCFISEKGKTFWSSNDGATACMARLPADSNAPLVNISATRLHPIAEKYQNDKRFLLTSLRGSDNKPFKYFVASTISGGETRKKYISNQVIRVVDRDQVSVSSGSGGMEIWNVAEFNIPRPSVANATGNKMADLLVPLVSHGLMDQTAMAGQTPPSNPVPISSDAGSPDRQNKDLLIHFRQDSPLPDRLYVNGSPGNVEADAVFVGDLPALSNSNLVWMGRNHLLGLCKISGENGDLRFKINSKAFPDLGDPGGLVSVNRQNPSLGCEVDSSESAESYLACHIRNALFAQRCFPAAQLRSLIHFQNMSDSEILRAFFGLGEEKTITGTIIKAEQHFSYDQGGGEEMGCRSGDYSLDLFNLKDFRASVALAKCDAEGVTSFYPSLDGVTTSYDSPTSLINPMNSSSGFYNAGTSGLYLPYYHGNADVSWNADKVCAKRVYTRYRLLGEGGRTFLIPADTQAASIYAYESQVTPSYTPDPDWQALYYNPYFIQERAPYLMDSQCLAHYGNPCACNNDGLNPVLAPQLSSPTCSQPASAYFNWEPSSYDYYGNWSNQGPNFIPNGARYVFNDQFCRATHPEHFSRYADTRLETLSTSKKPSALVAKIIRDCVQGAPNIQASCKFAYGDEDEVQPGVCTAKGLVKGYGALAASAATSTLTESPVNFEFSVPGASGTQNVEQCYTQSNAFKDATSFCEKYKNNITTGMANNGYQSFTRPASVDITVHFSQTTQLGSSFNYSKSTEKYVGRCVFDTVPNPATGALEISNVRGGNASSSAVASGEPDPCRLLIRPVGSSAQPLELRSLNSITTTNPLGSLQDCRSALGFGLGFGNNQAAIGAQLQQSIQSVCSGLSSDQILKIQKNYSNPASGMFEVLVDYRAPQGSPLGGVSGSGGTSTWAGSGTGPGFSNIDFNQLPQSISGSPNLQFSPTVPGGQSGTIGEEAPLLGGQLGYEISPPTGSGGQTVNPPIPANNGYQPANLPSSSLYVGQCSLSTQDQNIRISRNNCSLSVQSVDQKLERDFVVSVPAPNPLPSNWDFKSECVARIVSKYWNASNPAECTQRVRSIPEFSGLGDNIDQYQDPGQPRQYTVRLKAKIGDTVFSDLGTCSGPAVSDPAADPANIGSNDLCKLSAVISTGGNTSAGAVGLNLNPSSKALAPSSWITSTPVQCSGEWQKVILGEDLTGNNGAFCRLMLGDVKLALHNLPGSSNVFNGQAGQTWSNDPYSGAIVATVDFSTEHRTAAGSNPTVTLETSCQYRFMRTKRARPARYAPFSPMTPFSDPHAFTSQILISPAVPEAWDLRETTWVNQIEQYYSDDSNLEEKTCYPVGNEKGPDGKPVCADISAGTRYVIAGGGGSIFGSYPASQNVTFDNSFFSQFCSDHVQEIAPIPAWQQPDRSLRIPVWVVTESGGRLTVPETNSSADYYCQVPQCSMIAEFGDQRIDLQPDDAGMFEKTPTSRLECEEIQKLKVDSICAGRNNNPEFDDSLDLYLSSKFGEELSPIGQCPPSQTARTCTIGVRSLGLRNGSIDDLYVTDRIDSRNKALLVESESHATGTISGLPNTLEACFAAALEINAESNICTRPAERSTTSLGLSESAVVFGEISKPIQPCQSASQLAEAVDVLVPFSASAVGAQSAGVLEDLGSVLIDSHIGSGVYNTENVNRAIEEEGSYQVNPNLTFVAFTDPSGTISYVASDAAAGSNRAPQLGFDLVAIYFNNTTQAYEKILCSSNRVGVARETLGSGTLPGIDPASGHLTCGENTSPADSNQVRPGAPLLAESDTSTLAKQETAIPVVPPNEAPAGKESPPEDGASPGRDRAMGATAFIESEGKLLCQGAILSGEWVLTSAHCIENIKELNIIAGTSDLTGFEKTGTVHKVAQTILHEDYDPRTGDNDIALIAVAEPIVFNERTKPALLPSRDEKPGPGDAFEAFGFPKQSDDPKIVQTAVIVLSPEDTLQITGESEVESGHVIGYKMQKDAAPRSGHLTFRIDKELTLVSISLVNHEKFEENGVQVDLQLAPYSDWIEKNTGLPQR